MRANHVRNCTRLRIICYATVRSAPVEQSKGTKRESEEESERVRGNDLVELVLRRRGPTPTGDAFTYLTCNNLEKVLTMARGSPRFEWKTRRYRDETEGRGIGREYSTNESLKSQRMAQGHVRGRMFANQKLFMELIS